MHARALTSKIMLADFYESICARNVDPKIAATWTADVFLGELNYRDLVISSFDGEGDWLYPRKRSGEGELL